MSSDRYRQELDSIKASDDFKQHTKNRLLLALDTPEPAPPSRRARLQRVWRRRVLPLAGTAFVAVLCWQLGRSHLNVGTPPVQAPSALSGSAAPSQPSANEAAGGAVPSPSSSSISVQEQGSAAPTPSAPPAEAERSLPVEEPLPAVPVPSSMPEPAPGAQADLVLRPVEQSETPAGSSPASSRVSDGDACLPASSQPAGSQTQNSEIPASGLTFQQPEDQNPAASTPPDDAPLLPDTLAVLRNSALAPDAEGVSGYTGEELVGIAGRQAAALGLTVQSISVEPEREAADTPAAAVALCDGAQVTASADGLVRVMYDEPPALAAVGGEALPDAGALAEQLPALLEPLEAPVVESTANVYPGGVTLYSLQVYEAGEDGQQAALNSLTAARLLLDETGRLTELQILPGELFEPLGEYPLIGEAAATERLAAGEGLTSLPVDFPGVEAVVSVSLEYRYTGSEEYLVPLYTFYVALPAEGGMAALADQQTALLGIWYVPAIDPAFIAEPE